MDFDSILQQANHNAKQGKKLVSELDQLAQEKQLRARERYEQALMREREERKRKAPPKVEKKFVIPKKKDPAEASVDPNALQSYLQKQKRAEIEKEIQKKKERDRLIQLRLEANQGKANKKIAAQFGKSAIELQQRYAPNSQVEMELLKRQQREEEELERHSSVVRESMNKALQSRAAVLARASSSSAKTAKKEPTRIGNVRPGGFAEVTSRHEAVLTKRKAEEFSTFSCDRSKEKKPKLAPAKPKPSGGGGAVLDFKTLMEQAQQNSDVKTVEAKTVQILRGQKPPAPPADSRSASMKPSSMEQQQRKSDSLARSSGDASRKNGQHTSSKPAPSNSSKSQAPPTSSARPDAGGRTNKPASSSSSASVARRSANPYEASDRYVLGAPAATKSTTSSNQATTKKPNRGDLPLPPIPQPPPSFAKREPRILPGDLRYKGPPPAPKPATSSSSTAIRTASQLFAADKPKKQSADARSSSSKDRPSASSSHGRATSPRPSSNGQFKRPLPPSHHRPALPQRAAGPSSSSAHRYDKIHARPAGYADARSRSNPSKFGRHPPPGPFAKTYNYSDDEDEFEDEEDEYDSEMDDFIDDSEVHELETADFEESLRAINRNYDKRKWQMRERMIDERRMDARYREIEQEERRSSKLALMEDLLEAQKENTTALCS